MRFGRTRTKLIGLLGALVFLSVSLTASFHFHPDNLPAKSSEHCVVCQVAHQAGNADLNAHADLPLLNLDGAVFFLASQLISIPWFIFDHPSRAPPSV